ncbi:MAG: hypothetical protein J0L73_27585, partial [Verrucomicrobia bacterium]|nr:hypothetical protein [Verrucomicrobiota bacterium]
MKPHPLRTHRAAWPPIIAAVLLALLPTLRAGTAVDPPGSLQFSLEIHLGKSDEIHVHLNAKGFFMVHSAGMSTTGSLPAAESLRIFAEFEKLCAATGVEGSPPRRGLGGRVVSPYFQYESPQGKILSLEGRDPPPPPALTAFLITLSQKLLHHASKNPRPTPAPSSILLPPQNPPA